MSLLETILGGAMQGAGRSMIEEDARKKDYIDRKRELAENERLYRRNRKDQLADEERRLGREVQREYVDSATGEMVTVYKNGQESRRKLTADEIKTREREDAEYTLNSEYKRALIGSMNRPSGGGGGSGRGPAKPSDAEARALAAMTVGPEPDKERDPELHAEWYRNFNRAFLAAKNGAAPPSGRRAVPAVPVTPVRMKPGEWGGPEEYVGSLIQAALNSQGR